MQALLTNPIFTEQDEQQETLEQLLRLYADDPAFQDELRELFAPLLNGEMNYEEHRAYLRKHYGA